MYALLMSKKFKGIDGSLFLVTFSLGHGLDAVLVMSAQTFARIGLLCR